jgi:chromosomal replication initiation ATPase DnaA
MTFVIFMPVSLRELLAALMASFQKGGTLMLTLDMRMDIITKQYAKEFPGQQLQSDIAREIAELLPDASGGELEGTLTRIVAYASLTDQEVSVPLVRDVLNKTTGEEERL